MSVARELRLTSQTLSVLTVLLEDPDRSLHGFELLRRTGVKSGTIYPLLARLERLGWLQSQWEDVDPQTVARPRRRYYMLTDLGRHHARAAIQDSLDRERVSQRRSTGPLAPERLLA
jgi:PadR family transcriptional regulator, regulatory protein PadR